MTIGIGHTGFALFLAAAIGALALVAGTRPALAQEGTSDPLNTGQTGTPVEIEAAQGIEWRRNEKTYIARYSLGPDPNVVREWRAESP